MRPPHGEERLAGRHANRHRAVRGGRRGGALAAFPPPPVRARVANARAHARSARYSRAVMETQLLDPAERTVREACATGRIDEATSAAIRRYGPEVLGFLVGVYGDYDAATEAFSMFSERLWQSMRGFEWRCSLRTWCYRLARHAAIDLRRGERGARRGAGRVGLSSAPEVMALAARVRTDTLSALRSANRTALERLRDELPEEDRALLVLRIDRQLEWREIAIAIADSSGDAARVEEEPALKREAARLRKRFQLVTLRLRAVARERKLV